MNCDHANECPVACPCKEDCICRRTITDGGTEMCMPEIVTKRAEARKKRESDDNPFSFMEGAISGFSHVKYAEEQKEPKCNLDFGSLDEDESLKARRFWDLHDSLHGRYSGAIGGRHTWEITNTSIGCVWVTRCGMCREKLNVTNYNLW